MSAWAHDADVALVPFTFEEGPRFGPPTSERQTIPPCYVS